VKNTETLELILLRSSNILYIEFKKYCLYKTMFYQVILNKIPHSEVFNSQTN